MLSTARSSVGPQTYPDVALLGDGLYSVMDSQRTLGFVDRVGDRYVALRGELLTRAVEVGQSSSLQHAILLVSFTR